MRDLSGFFPSISEESSAPGRLLYQQLGVVPERTGNTSPNSAPRNIHPVASSTNCIADRVVTLVGRADLIEQGRLFDAGVVSGPARARA